MAVGDMEWRMRGDWLPYALLIAIPVAGVLGLRLIGVWFGG